MTLVALNMTFTGSESTTKQSRMRECVKDFRYFPLNPPTPTVGAQNLIPPTQKRTRL